MILGRKPIFPHRKTKTHFLKLYGQTPKRLFLVVFSRTKFVFIAKAKYSRQNGFGPKNFLRKKWLGVDKPTLS